MKKMNFTKAFLFLVAILFAQTYIMAQDILDVAPFDGNNDPQLANVINADTMANGDRFPDRVYRLERGEIYLMTSTINANYTMRIIAGGDENLRPPMIISGKSQTGSNIRPFFKLKEDGTTNYFRDVFFNGVDLDRKYDAEWFQALIMEGDDMSTAFEGCIFNAFTGGATNFSGSDNSIYFRDCTWRNGVWSTHPFVGQQVTMPALPIDTLIVTNCTYFNNNAFWLFQEDGLANFTVIEHNTIYTSLIDMMRLRYTSNTNIRSNLFYGTHAFGDTPSSQAANWYEPDGSAYSIISIYEAPEQLLTDAGLTEGDRLIELTHNAWFTPQPIKDYWNADATISAVTFMNTRTMDLFADAGHPYFNSNNNLEKDPMFSDATMESWVVGEVADFCTNYRSSDSDNGHALDGNGGGNRNYDEQQGVDILTEIQWPLPESMVYTDAELLIGGHDGLPVGDLNWYPDKRAMYDEPTELGPTSIKDLYTLEFSIAPNPAHSELLISSVEDAQLIEIYSLLGRKMIAQSMEGQISMTLDISALPNGIYMIFISSKDGGGSKLFVKQ